MQTAAALRRRLDSRGISQPKAGAASHSKSIGAIDPSQKKLALRLAGACSHPTPPSRRSRTAPECRWPRPL